MKTLVFVGPNSTDDVAEFVNKHDRSILIEPGAGPVSRLRTMFAGREDVEIVEAACAEKDGRALMHWYNRGLSSSLAMVTQDAKQRFHLADWSGGAEYPIDTIHLGNWLERNGVEYIDTLIIDAQGYDLTILKTVESYLAGRVGTIKTEADAEGFKHYHGPDNSFDAQAEFLKRFGYEATRSSATVTFHPDVIWERTNEDQISAGLERVQGGVGVA